MPDWRRLWGWSADVPSTNYNPEPRRREVSARLFRKLIGQEKSSTQPTAKGKSLKAKDPVQVLKNLSPESVKKGEDDDPSTSSKEPQDSYSEPLATSQTFALTPPTLEDIDRWTYHTDLQTFAKSLQIAANAVLPNDKTSRYEKVSVLMLSWADEDPQLPVSLEIQKLVNVFQDCYRYNVEQWKIPDENCHFELASKVMAFVEPRNDSNSHLKIVYYAGHATLLDTRALALTSWRNKKNSRCPRVKWGAIQSFIEESPNDALILLDCCASGTANTSEGSGVTEIITACAWNQIANGVGEYSLTNALVVELQLLSLRRSFSVGELYRNVFLRTQSRLPTMRTEDGRHWERHPAPIHLVLTQDTLRPRSIQLSVQPLPPSVDARPVQIEIDGTEPLPPDLVSGSILNTGLAEETSQLNFRSTERFPRLVFAVRLGETFRPSDDIKNLFASWLRDMPAIAEEVKIEAGFDSFSTLLIVSIPFALSAYVPSHAAVLSLGPILSENKIVDWTPITPGPAPTASVTHHAAGMAAFPAQASYQPRPPPSPEDSPPSRRW